MAIATIDVDGQMLFLGNFSLLDANGDTFTDVTGAGSPLVGQVIDSRSQIIDGFTLLNDDTGDNNTAYTSDPAQDAGVSDPNTPPGQYVNRLGAIREDYPAGSSNPGGAGPSGDQLVIDGVASDINHVFRVNVDKSLESGGTQNVAVFGIQLDDGNVYLFDLANSLDGATFTQLTVTGVTETGTNFSVREFLPGGGIHSGELPFTCFTQDVRILTEHGEVAIEDLKIGDMVATVDRGFQPIRWIGASSVTLGAQLANPKLKPILIRKGAMGRGLPRRDLTVSRQHRMLMTSALDGQDVLTPAIKLVHLDGIEQVETVRPVSYYHICFDRHEVIHAEGALAESLYLGKQALSTLSPEAREEIETLFPAVMSEDFVPDQARQFERRHVKLRDHFA